MTPAQPPPRTVTSAAGSRVGVRTAHPLMGRSVSYPLAVVNMSLQALTCCSQRRRVAGMAQAQVDAVPRWRDDGFRWTELPRPWSVDATGWSYTDVVVTGQGDLVTAHPDGGALVWVAPDGTSSTCSLPVVEAHGLAVVPHDGGDTLWVADNGTKLVAEPAG